MIAMKNRDFLGPAHNKGIKINNVRCYDNTKTLFRHLLPRGNLKEVVKTS